MTATDEDPDNSSSRSYFAFIPVFKRRRKSVMERNIIKIIDESNICRSSPVLKTLIKENVRICCIVVETSGKQSVRILCASAPVILHLISKTNPNIEKFLKNEKVTSYFKVLSESDFEPILNNVCQTVVIIHAGVKKVYSTIFVSMLKDTWLHSEKSLLYLLKLMFNLLQSGFDCFCDNVVPIVLSIYHQNLAIASYIIDFIPHLITALIKYLTTVTYNAKSAMTIGFKFFRKCFTYFTCILNFSCRDSTLSNTFKKLCMFFKLSLDYLQANNTCRRVEEFLHHLYEITKPYVMKYLVCIFETVKSLVQSSMPLVKDCINYAVKEVIPLLRHFVEDNLESILNAYNVVKSFLFENSHYIKLFCCDTCRFINSSICYLYNILQAVLPAVIEFSSGVAISFMTCISFILEACSSLCSIFFSNVLSHLETHKQLLCHLSIRALKVFKIACRMILKVRPYIVLIFRVVLNELIQLIHELSPTLLPCIYEMNSSAIHASTELLAKSCLAVKRIMPSFYCATKTVLPHTFQAVNELIKSSTKSVIVVYPTILTGLITIYPEIKAGMIVLFSDGNKACLEVISTSYSASCHVKDAAKSVSTNLPVASKALREVFTTTAFAAIVVSSTSVSAKSRVVKDIMKGTEMVHSSFALAEQEIVTVYMDFIFEMNSIMPPAIESKLSNSNALKYLGNYFCQVRENSSEKIVSLYKNSVNVLDNLVVNTKMTFQYNLRALVNILCYLFFFICTFCMNVLKLKSSKTTFAEKIYYPFFSNLSNSLISIIQRLGNKITHLNTKVIRKTIVGITKSWHIFKSNVRAFWARICKRSPRIWIKIELLTASFWNFLLENIPGAWILWKIFCSQVWESIEDFAPCFWRHVTAVIPVLWSYGRQLAIRSWGIFVTFSSSLWQRTTCVLSEYWVISETYLPRVWFAGCNQTRKSWYVTCYVIENCWNLTVETCFLSWNILHCSVATAWGRSLVVTKIAYCIFITSGTSLQKSFYVCFKSSRYVFVILEITPHLGGMALKPFRIFKLRNMFYVPGIGQQTKTGISHSCFLEKHRVIKNSIVSTVNSVPGAHKLLRFGVLIPSKLFIRNQLLKKGKVTS